jgi:hypothetical protein
LALVVDDGLEHLLAAPAFSGIMREEDEAGAVAPGFGQRDADLAANAREKLVGHLDQDPGAVAGVRLAAARAPMEEVLENREGLADDLVGLAPLDVHDEPDAAGLVLVGGIVKALCGRDAEWG